MNKNLGVIMPTKNINRNTSSTTTSQTITSRSTDLATTMPVANRRSEEGKTSRLYCVIFSPLKECHHIMLL
jgi:hypothetical protein